MKTLITGANGYVGSHLREIFFGDCISLDQVGPADIVDCISHIDQWQGQLQEVTQVIHLADLRLQHYTPETIKSQVTKQRAFVNALKNLPKLENVVVASTCSVYGWQEEVIDEIAETKPTSLYAEAKLKMEEALVQSGLPFTILRFATAYGGHQKIRLDLFVNTLVKAAIDREPFELFSAECFRPYVDVRDMARAFIHFADRPQNRIINVSECNLSKAQVVESLVHHGLGKDSIQVVANKSEIRNYRVQKQLVTQLGFEFLYDFNQGVSHLIRHLADSSRARATEQIRL